MGRKKYFPPPGTDFLKRFCNFAPPERFGFPKNPVFSSTVPTTTSCGRDRKCKMRNAKYKMMVVGNAEDCSLQSPEMTDPVGASFCTLHFALCILLSSRSAGLDFFCALCYIASIKAVKKTWHKASRSERLRLVERGRNTTLVHTTFEPQVGNGPPGAPVIASMSDGPGRNQGGTVEYCLYPTPDLSGAGIFYTFPQ